ncbi:methyltransferase [Legionella jamestowniensis]|nr:methyltransferase [Legionella jamestowniensis]KTD07711.1 methyltransferase [Legionella jamestowniensis]SFL61032.1 Methyltransferase domain-containing protein [Legionella jamestowniensis DSM 19215]
MRSKEKELIDLGPDFYTPEEYLDCLKKLFRVNKLLGVFRDTKKLLKTCSKQATLLDIGCGNGLFLLNLSRHFPQMQMLGVDINKEAIAAAKKALHGWNKNNLKQQLAFKAVDFKTVINTGHFDILLATLFCHHLNDEELIEFLHHSYHHAKEAVVIHDLHRHWLAYGLYKFISPWLFRNRLITHDGLISIKRGFTRSEWKVFLANAGVSNYQLKWCWPFRWQLTLRK